MLRRFANVLRSLKISSFQSTNQGLTKEELLSLDLEEKDLLYRIRKGGQIVYVLIDSPTTIPRQRRNDSYFILNYLRLLPRWSSDDWQTMTVDGSSKPPRCEFDLFPPHGLPSSALQIPRQQYYDFRDMNIKRRISDRVFVVDCEGRTRIMKIAKFKHEIGYLRCELETYNTLIRDGFTGAPEFHGYIYEETQDRVIGFLMEYLEGEHPDVRDLPECQNLLQRVHDCGLVHGDPNRYNWTRTKDGMKIFDFEAAQQKTPELAEDELKSLADRLSDESGIGRR